MARCKNCNFNLEHHNDLACAPGRCDGCNQRVCYRCGCTETTPCTNGALACSWAVLTFGVTESMEIGMAILELAPGLCSFCFNNMAAAAYAEVVAAEERILLVDFGVNAP